MNLSVIICTHNRAGCLWQTLQSISDIKILPNLKWELIVVDNNSNDQTPEVCRNARQRLPLKYIFEKHQGKGYALNKGVSCSKGELIAFTDDDVDVDPLWVAELCVGSQRYLEASIFGGPVKPRWEVMPPVWLIKHSKNLLGSIAVHYEINSNDEWLRGEDIPFVGANMAVRRDVFEKGARFTTLIGPCGEKTAPGEDSLFIKELLTKQYRAIYISKAIVYHRNGCERMTEKYLRQWYVGAGISSVRLGQVAVSQNTLFGAPRYLWRNLLMSTLKYLLTRWIRSSDLWIKAEICMATTWGRILEFRRKSRSLKSY